MIIRQDYTTYSILESKVNIISDVVGGWRNTIAEVEDNFYYLGDEPDNLTTAVIIWQKINKRILSKEEYIRVLSDNNIIQIN